VEQAKAEVEVAKVLALFMSAFSLGRVFDLAVC
jgi:hypothetical protein